jgi:hypothetical protein
LRPQAVVADATASSLLGEYLTKVLGPPTASADGLIGWQLAGMSWPSLNAAAIRPDASLLCGGIGMPRPGCNAVT